MTIGYRFNVYEDLVNVDGVQNLLHTIYSKDSVHILTNYIFSDFIVILLLILFSIS